MSKQKPPFEISREYEVVVPEKEKAYPVTVSEWERIKTKVKRLSGDYNLFHTIGSVSFGFSASAFIGAITIGNNYQICWTFFWVTFIAGVLSLYFGHQQRKIKSVFKDDILEDMEFIEKRFSQIN